MPYISNFDPQLISKGSKIRSKIDNDHYDYYTIGDFFPQFGWEVRINKNLSYRTTGILLYIKPSDFPGIYELEID